MPDGTVTTSSASERWERFDVLDKTAVAYLQDLEANGYVIIPGLISSDEAASLKHELGELETSVGKKYPSARPIQVRVGELLSRRLSFCRLLMHPSVLSVVRAYLGNNMRLATWSSNTLLPQDGSQDANLYWHVDYPYHDIDLPWPTEVLGAQVFWLLDDFTPTNGATMFWPQSHKRLTLPENRDSTPPEAQLLLGKAGSVFLAHSAWWHRQTKNVSLSTRSAVLGNFVKSYVIPKSCVEEEYEHLVKSDFVARLSEVELATVRRLTLGAYGRALKGYHE
eukprot:CAMPEP_0184645984 /NCGR_PEP_ID=MMETSP0308-20130426/2616_1 /TAXON_ID=38269 /ORGANISM="Gloeochaete witrockiana, Strain SAG 46.84" /LENGTH=279 /DNA_ID=CAMNT_0027075579 /DNA_START=1711 /DNA_END=2550 /DNA_ORIENTATION=+